MPGKAQKSFVVVENGVKVHWLQDGLLTADLVELHSRPITRYPYSTINQYCNQVLYDSLVILDPPSYSSKLHFKFCSIFYFRPMRLLITAADDGSSKQGNLVLWGIDLTKNLCFAL